MKLINSSFVFLAAVVLSSMADRASARMPQSIEDVISSIEADNHLEIIDSVPGPPAPAPTAASNPITCIDRSLEVCRLSFYYHTQLFLHEQELSTLLRPLSMHYYY